MCFEDGLAVNDDEKDSVLLDGESMSACGRRLALHWRG